MSDHFSPNRWFLSVSVSVPLSLAIAVTIATPLTADEPDASEPPRYPINVAVADGTAFVVDLDLPGVWRVADDSRTLFVRGSGRLRQPLNRPRCVAIHPRGGLLVGDTATREVYHVAEAGADPRPLIDGRLGIPMALAVAPGGDTIYVGDAESRAVWRFPVEGGAPERVAEINARGLAFDSQGRLWAVTPDAEAIWRIDPESGDAEVVLDGRPFGYPNGLTVLDDDLLVTDGYGKSVWRVTADGQAEVWHAGEPLIGPVGILAAEGSLWVVDPKAVQLFRVDPQTKSLEPRL